MSGLSRFPDWRTRLVAYLSASVRLPFEDGKHDCALFLAGGVLAMTGQDFAAPYRGRYTTIAGGIRILRKDGYDDHVDLARAHLAQKSPAFANEGDGAVVQTEDGPSLGIVQGAQVYVLAPSGMVLVPLSLAHTVLEV